MELLTDSMAATVRISSEQLYLGQEGQSMRVQRKAYRNRYTHGKGRSDHCVRMCPHMQIAINGYNSGRTDLGGGGLEVKQLWGGYPWRGQESAEDF